MDISDRHRKIIKNIKITYYDLLILSSMGQDSIDWKDWVPELFIGIIKKLIKVLNLEMNNINYYLLCTQIFALSYG